MARLVIPARGDPRGLAATLACVSQWAQRRAVALVVLDDRPGDTYTADIAAQAARHRAWLVRDDEVDGWLALEAALLQAAHGELVIVVEAGTMPTPTQLDRAVTTMDSAATVGGVLLADDHSLDIVLAHTPWPRLAPYRGHGGIWPSLPAHWATAQQASWLRAPRATPPPAGAPGDVWRNRLVGEMHTTGTIASTLATIDDLDDRTVADIVLDDVQGEWGGALARFDAWYWLPHQHSNGGWRAAWAALDAHGAARAMRRFRSLDATVSGPVRRRVQWTSICDRTERAEWNSVAIIEGAFRLAHNELPGSAPHAAPSDIDVILLDRPTIDAGPTDQLAVVLSRHAAAPLAAALAHDPDPLRALRELADTGTVQIAGLSDPIVQPLPNVGPWALR